MPLGWDLGVIGVKSLIFMNLAMWHIILKGVIIRTGNKYFLSLSQSADLRVESKGQISSNFIESVGICNSAPWTVHSSYIFFQSKCQIVLIQIKPNVLKDPG